MRADNRIDQKFAQLKHAGEKALIAYIIAGDPDLDTTGELVLALEKSGTDIIEIGVPFSDPVADGPVIQQASERALKNGITLKKIIAFAKKIRKSTDIPLVLMGYFNSFLRYGLDNFSQDAAEGGVDGIIVPDLPREESDEFSELLAKQGIHLIRMVAPTSGHERMKKLCDGAKGFIYCVSLTGVTGVKELDPTELAGFMSNVRQCGVPAVVGFGISGPEQARQAAEYSDGVVVGSAFVRIIAHNAADRGNMVSVVGNLAEQLKGALKN